ncbi:MAG: transcriptional regulator [Candidatus Geothermincolia bacterium]
MADNAEKVLKAMKKAGEPVRAGDVATLTGMSKEEVNAALNELKKSGKIMSPKRCFWAPAE